MPILSLPTSPNVRSSRIGLVAHTQTFVSPLSRVSQTQEQPGSLWQVTFEYPPMTRAQAGVWLSFLVKLRGRSGRFYGGDSTYTTPRGVATGTPLVNGAAQIGSTLNTKGWSGPVTGIMLAGDYIAYDVPSGLRQLHLVVADANSDAGGLAALVIEPAIRESPAADAGIITSSPTTVMGLVSDDQAAWGIDTAQHHGIAFNALQELTL